MKKAFLILPLLFNLLACGGGSSQNQPAPIQDVAGMYQFIEATPTDCRDLFSSGLRVNQSGAQLTFQPLGASDTFRGTIDDQSRISVSGQLHDGSNVVNVHCAGSYGNNTASLTCNLDAGSNGVITCSVSYGKNNNTTSAGTSGGTVLLPSNSGGSGNTTSPGIATSTNDAPVLIPTSGGTVRNLEEAETEEE